MASVIDNLFGGRPPGWDSPAVGGFAVTKSDTVNDPNGPFRALCVGASGDVKVTMLDDTVVTWPSLAAGVLHPIACKRVWSTGTGPATIVGAK